jgi:hypothetical protein
VIPELRISRNFKICKRVRTPADDFFRADPVFPLGPMKAFTSSSLKDEALRSSREEDGIEGEAEFNF